MRSLLAACSAALFITGGTAAAAEFDPHSTATAPCGVGIPAPGHTIPEISATNAGVTLTVRQDHDRLCYVAADNADAPILRLRQGDDLIVTLRNEITDPAAIEAVTAAGELKQPNPSVPDSDSYYKIVPGMHHPASGRTNLHLHGFAVSPLAPQDDVLTVCADPATGPAICGHRELGYRVHVPADMPEGLYWYHPHIHGEVQAQLLMGLSGAIIVDGPAAEARRAAGITERVLVVRQTQDIDAGSGGGSPMIGAPPGIVPPTGPAAAGPADAIDAMHELLCSAHSGIDAISLNGTPIPLGDGPDASLAQYAIPAGGKQLWRLLNAANDAFLNLAVVDAAGHVLPVDVVARDGAPVTDDAGTPHPLLATREPQMVPPSGRIEFLVSAPPPGSKAYLVTHAVDTGCAGDRLPERRLAVLTVGETAVQTAVAAPPAKEPSLFSGLMSRKTERERVIALAEYPRPGKADETDFYIAERKPGVVLKPFEMGDAPAITVKAGTTEEWVVENWTHELHAFHIHQLHFRVLAVDGQPVAETPLLDVVNVPYATATGYRSPEGPLRPGRVRLKLFFPEALAGDIPFHCHLTDHEDNGMMAVLRVLPATGLVQKAALETADLDHPPICRPEDRE